MINIEICKGHTSDKWSIRIGDIEGSTSESNISKEELFEAIKEAINETDDGHDINCEGSMCWCKARLKKSKEIK